MGCTQRWLRAIHSMTGHSNGTSAAQLKNQLGRSNMTARLLLLKLHQAMQDSYAAPPFGVAEADETSVPFRPNASEPWHRGNSPKTHR